MDKDTKSDSDTWKLPVIILYILWNITKHKSHPVMVEIIITFVKKDGNHFKKSSEGGLRVK